MLQPESLEKQLSNIQMQDLKRQTQIENQKASIQRLLDRVTELENECTWLSRALIAAGVRPETIQAIKDGTNTP